VAYHVNRRRTLKHAAGDTRRRRVFALPRRGVCMTITLYRLEGCPYCEFVVDKLEELDVPFDSVWVEGPHSKRDEVKTITGQRQVPVVVDDDYGVSMSQSARIFEFLETTYGDAESPAEVDTDF
jgi:glutaredoxin